MDDRSVVSLIEHTPAIIAAIAALVGAVGTLMNRRSIKRVEKQTNGQIARLAEHLEQARLTVAKLEEEYREAVKASASQQRRRKPHPRPAPRRAP